MGIRETLNKNPAIATGLTIGVIALALAWIVWYQFLGDESGPYASGIPKSWYTVDDGVTLFADDTTKVAPFDYNGKSAVQALVYLCDGKQTVAYLQRYSTEAKKKLDTANAAIKDGKGSPIDIEMIMVNGMEVKRPKDTAWVSMSTALGRQITTSRCPPGTKEELDCPAK